MNAAVVFLVALGKQPLYRWKNRDLKTESSSLRLLL